MRVLVFGVCSQLVNWKKAPVRIKSHPKLGGLTGKLAEEVGEKSQGQKNYYHVQRPCAGRKPAGMRS